MAPNENIETIKKPLMQDWYPFSPCIGLPILHYSQRAAFSADR